MPTKTTTKPRRAADVAPITGVATGNLGTGSNLDDTQVFLTSDLPIDDPPSPEGPPPAQIPDQQPPPIKFPGDVPAEAPGDSPPPMDAPRREPGPIDAAATRSGNRGRPVPWAAFTAAALGAMLVGALLGAAANAPSGPNGEAQVAGPITTIAPTPDQAEAGGKGNGGGGKGNGNGKGNN